ncbi:hypothetical protein F2P81_015548 [Scophthalmus maximus]|uniref:Shisa N-terminal domain-containing protein n=1 Tax=Scophthalmus maximus TaxID=52904 RepID=A0A6A4SM83_SCOMX|nr:hypothetical protein F2P81_015548 [Scophthalmus maximus]
MMGIQHLLLLLIYLDPLNVLCAAAAAASSSSSSSKKSKAPQRRNPKLKEVNGSTTAVPVAAAVPGRITQLQAPSVPHDTCLGYYDVSGQYDKEFACNNTDHRFCCGSCFLRFCCADRGKRLEQKSCTNYNTPDWIKTQPPSPAPTGDTYDPELDQTNATVYITCGVVALVIAIGISAKVAYDKATKPPQEMNVHRALADILRQQGPVPISQYDHENIAEIDGSPKDETPVRTSKNHYTPVHTKASNHGHYGKENLRGGGQDMHNFISSGFVTLGRGHLKALYVELSVGGNTHLLFCVEVDSYFRWFALEWTDSSNSPRYTCRQHHDDMNTLNVTPRKPKHPTSGNHHHDYQHSHLDLTALTPKLERPQRMNNILTSATEAYDLSLSRSFQNLSHLPPSYELALQPDLSKYSSSLHRLRRRCDVSSLPQFIICSVTFSTMTSSMRPLLDLVTSERLPSDLEMKCTFCFFLFRFFPSDTLDHTDTDHVLLPPHCVDGLERASRLLVYHVVITFNRFLDCKSVLLR